MNLKCSRKITDLLCKTNHKRIDFGRDLSHCSRLFYLKIDDSCQCLLCTYMSGLNPIIDHNYFCAYSGIQEIKFTIHETDWANEHEIITSLNDKYKPLFVWNDGQSWPNQTVNGRLYYPE